MVFIVFFFVKLTILQLCVADLGYKCTEDLTRQQREIILLQSDNPTHELLNNVFIEKCSDFYKISTENISHNGIQETLKRIETQHKTTIINLYVPDYYEYVDPDEVPDILMYAGDLINTTETKTCIAINKTKPQYSCEIVKVISKTEIAGELDDFVDTIEIIDEKIHTRESCSSVFENTGNLKTVLLCVEADTNEDNVKVHIEPLKLLITTMDSCKAYIQKFHNLLTVLAPKPFEMDSEYLVPVVFYKTPYMCPKLEPNFSNSMTLAKWQLLKHAILKFLNLMGWQRVVVVSDNAFYSIEFENELTALLYKAKIAYTVIRCEETVYDMGKVTRSLQNVKARIVIANVEENNAIDLIKHAAPNIVWLLRDKSETVKVNSNNHRVFAFSLGTSVEQSRNCGLNENILDGLSSISHAYKFMKNKNYKISKIEFYRQFLKVMKRTRYPESIAYVDRLYFWGSQHISSMHVKDDGAEVINFEDPFAGVKKPVDGPSCLARSSDYFKHCENTLVILFMFVIILFSTTILLIACYFHKSSPFHDIRYQNF